MKRTMLKNNSNDMTDNQKNDIRSDSKVKSDMKKYIPVSVDTSNKSQEERMSSEK